MNESIFFLHLFFVLGFLWIALKRGKETLYLFVVLQVVFANLFLVKQMRLFGWDVTCSDVYAVGALLGLNCIREIYGAKKAQTAISLSFLALLFFLCMSKVHLFYLPNCFDTTHDAFSKIFSSTARIVLASLSVFYLVQKFDAWLYGFLKKHKENLFFLRMNGSLLCSQFLDTVAFTMLGLLGVVGSVVDVIFVSFAIKAVVIFLYGTFLPFLQPLIRRADHDL